MNEFLEIKDELLFLQKNSGKLPNHIGFIMDGNRRFAKKRRFAIVEGHKSGAEKMHEIVKFLAMLGIKYMTVYAFSTENKKRSAIEVTTLMDLLLFYLDKYDLELKEADVKLTFIGEIDELNYKVKNKIKEAEEKSKNRQGLNLIIAFNYGSRMELLRACQKFYLACSEDEKLISENNPDVLRSFLYLPDVPDVDFIIRCGGELRLSNFLMWQAAYSEFYFTDTLWPELEMLELCKALNIFMKRERRFGGTV